MTSRSGGQNASLGAKSVGPALRPELAEAMAAGITDGSSPDVFCTRAQAAVMVKRGTSR